MSAEALTIQKIRADLKTRGDAVRSPELASSG
jgi:hypothetical protein